MTRPRRFLVVCVTLLSAAALSARQSQTMFRAKSEIVRVDVLVLDHGKPVTGLTAADFQVLDNGVPYDADLALFENVPLNAILALDMSNSVEGDRLAHLTSASRALIGGLKNDDRAALITFSHAVELGSPLTTDRSQVLDGLARARSGGGTALLDASYASLIMGETDTGRSLVVVFSDGLDTSSWLDADAVRDTAKRGNTVVYGVSVKGPKPDVLHQLCEDTGGSMFEVESTKNLDATFLKVLAEFRQRYLVSYTPKTGPSTGWHKLEVRIKKRGGLTVKARPGYLVGMP